jgi:hypothetical protein
VVLPGIDPQGDHPTTVIAAKQPDGRWSLHVPTQSHTVLLDEAQVTELAGAMDPGGPAAIVIGVQDNSGGFHFLHAPITREGRAPLPVALVEALQTALGGLRTAHRLFGASRRPPPPRMASKAASG